MFNNLKYIWNHKIYYNEVVDVFEIVDSMFIPYKTKYIQQFEIYQES